MYTPPRMMPGQEPYTEAEYAQLQSLLAGALDEEETGGFAVGSREWMDREIALDEANDERKRRERNG